MAPVKLAKAFFQVKISLAASRHKDSDTQRYFGRTHMYVRTTVYRVHVIVVCLPPKVGFCKIVNNCLLGGTMMLSQPMLDLFACF